MNKDWKDNPDFTKFTDSAMSYSWNFGTKSASKSIRMSIEEIK